MIHLQSSSLLGAENCWLRVGPLYSWWSRMLELESGRERILGGDYVIDLRVIYGGGPGRPSLIRKSLTASSASAFHAWQ